MIRELFARARGWIHNWCRRRRRSRRRAGRRGGPAGPLRFEGLEGRWTPTTLSPGFTAATVVSGLGSSAAMEVDTAGTDVFRCPAGTPAPESVTVSELR